MENYTPFAFYRKFLEEEIYKEADKFLFYNTAADLLECYTNADGKLIVSGEITKIDEENYVTEYIHHGEKCVYSLENEIKETLETEIDKTIRYIEKGFENRLMNPKEVDVFAQFLSKNLEHIRKTKAYHHFSFLPKYFDKINDVISFHSSLNNSTEPLINNNVYSFMLVSEEPKKTIETLYEKLTSSNIITAYKEDFTKAFTGKIIKKGINWNVTGKNKQTSKVSLIYFIEQLVDYKFLHKTIMPNLAKYIKYVFRDKNGQIFKNIKQSNSALAFTQKPTLSTEIEEIISSL